MIPIISDREQETWLHEEKRLLDRIAKVFAAHGDKFTLKCGNPYCPQPTMQLGVDPHNANGAVLSCGCRDRHFKPRHVMDKKIRLV